MVDNVGNFIKYHGHTIICKLKDPSILSGLEDLIKKSKILKKYISPTPSSSYHMTITGLNRGADLEYLQNLCYLYSTPTRVSVEDVYFGDHPGISVKTMPKIFVLRNLLRKEAGMREESYHFHITFGYKFKNVDPGDYEEYAEDVTSIKNFIFSKFPTHEDFILLKAAKVCEFDDMTKFTEIILFEK